MSEINRYLCFSLGKEEYAIPLLVVKEVIGVPDITPVPQMPNFFLGIMNLRGSVISVMDLRIKMNIKPKANSETSIIILDLNGIELGVMVDCINSVAQVEKNQLAERPHLENTQTSDAIVAVFRKADILVMLLDIAKVLNVEDRNFLSKDLKVAA